MKQKRQLAILAGLLVVAGLVWYFAYFRGDKPSGDPNNVAAARSYKLLGIDNPELHWPELDRARKTEYKSNGRNPFSKEVPRPPSTLTARNNPVAHLPQGPMPPPPDPPPALPSNLKFFGYGVVPNGTSRRAFFSDGEGIFVVSEGETFLGRFRVLKISNTNLEFEEIATGRRNTAPLVEEPAGQPPNT